MGFPNRIIRKILGPQFVDVIPVEKPDSEIGADTWNTLFHQVAGMNLAMPARASCIAKWNGTDFDYAHRGEAWNPDGALAHPVLTRIGAGNYTYAFDPNYPDEKGVMQPTALVGARCSAHKPLTVFADRVGGFAWIDTVTPTLIQIRLWNLATGTAEDVAFWLEVG